jgi:hypothetical protein
MESASGSNSVDELVSTLGVGKKKGWTDATTGFKTKMDSISAKVYYLC